MAQWTCNYDRSNKITSRRGNSKNTKTILERFLNLEMTKKNPFTNEMEKMSVKEILNLKQISNAIEGDLASYK